MSLCHKGEDMSKQILTREDVLQNPEDYWMAPEYLRDDKELMLEVIDKNKGHIYYLSDRLKDDEEVVLKALIKSPSSVEFISDRLRDDREFIVKALHEMQDKGPGYAHLGSFVYESLSPRLKDDEEILCLLLEHTYYFLRFASDRLKANKDMLLKFKHSSYISILENASDSVKDDEDFLFKFKNPLEFASDRLKDDKDFVFKVLKEKNSGLIRYASERLRGDIELGMYVYSKCRSNAISLTPRLKDFFNGYKYNYHGSTNSEARMPYSHAVKIKRGRHLTWS